jgi:uncharacterized protein (TIGR04141 family)
VAFLLTPVTVPRQPQLHKLTLSLQKEGVRREDVLREVDRLSEHMVPALDTRSETLFVHAPPPHPPGWQAYLERHVRGGLANLYSSGAAAVLFVEASGREFALTFGQGRHLLDGELFEEDFGLKVVLNTVAPDRLRSVDAKNIDETTMHTRRDLSRESAFSAFGLDVTHDLLRAVTGAPTDETLAHRLTGADALGIWTRTQLPELPRLGERLLDAFGSEEYKKNFDFIDYLRPEKKPGRISDLNELLLQALNRREIDDVHLAAPEIVDWMELEGFQFAPSDQTELDADPRISRYLDTVGADSLDIERLKSDRLVAIRVGDQQVLGNWSVFKSIVYQVELDGEMFVLSGGRWFRVSTDFKERVYRDLGDLAFFEGLPDADAGTNEGDYNIKAAAALGGVCLDKRLVFDGGPDKMEICDILAPTGAMIHVKQRGSSSTLSHLFAQGVNSAERTLTDRDFRRQARQILAELDAEFAEAISEERPEPTAHPVVFAVITRSERQTLLTLPFFSILSLRTAVQRLRALGCPVFVAKVPEPSA